MPVRIYDIAKQLGIPSKEVLSKAKDLGISNARVPSSSLDKITAEFLVEQISGGKKPSPEPEVVAAPAEPAIKIVTAPPEEEAKAPEPEPAEEKTETEEASVSNDAAGDTEVVEVAETTTEGIENGKEEPGVAVEENAPASQLSDEPIPQTTGEATKEPTQPPAESKPGLGEKVGFIQLAPRVARPARPEKRGAKGARDDQKGTGATRDQRTQKGNFGDRNRQGGRPAQNRVVLPKDAKIISLKPPVIVRDLANNLGIKPFKLIADLMEVGVFSNVNQAVDDQIARQICAKYGFKFEVEKRSKDTHVVLPQKKVVSLDVDDKPEDLKPRAPIITIMGHVDHGKTTLLDVIRKANVVAGEAGGITQHIGAYTIAFPHPERKKDLQQLTFLDTPGHAAFSAMRARGADVTDIVILVVAANDGLMPQSIEALDHARAAKVPIIVAVNKMDHPAANAMKVREQLQKRGLVPDDWGGDTIFVEVSALQKTNIDKLIEMILLQADLLELKANPNRRAVGNVIESGVEPGGPTATVLVRKGTLRLGDVVICDQYFGKVRALINEENKRLKEAGPSVAVKVLGLNGVPEAGTEFHAVKNEKATRELAEERQLESKKARFETTKVLTFDTMFANMDENAPKTLKVVVKADTQGSAEAIVNALKEIESEKVKVEVLHSGVGAVAESDINLAAASKTIVIGFHTRVDNTAAARAKRDGVEIRLYSIIYELIDDIKLAMAGLLDPILKQVPTGTAEVRRVFDVSKGGNVAGCMVTSGKIIRGKVKISRNGDNLFEGDTQSLRRFQDEVNEVRSGIECGIRLEGFDQFEPGDIIESFILEKEAQSL